MTAMTAMTCDGGDLHRLAIMAISNHVTIVPMTDTLSSVGSRSYSGFADRYAAAVATKPHNALYERPAMLSLLPEVRGLRVLDAGCGPGLYAEWLAQQGASVVAVDGVTRMVELAQERTRGLAVEARVANLEEPLQWLADASFNLVMSPLVLDYIRDWRKVFREFNRLLVKGGRLVFSTVHPAFDWIALHRSRESYFAVELVSAYFTGFGEPHHFIEYYRRPMEEVLNPLIESGFLIDRVLEPRPSPEMGRADPKLFRQLCHEPAFLCVRAVRG
jgi:2-polyprenyl-6-hydroxyphenyl methylase/3-demethylubiquinone-9 3-methyltransferase